jgi:hypothetical protein
MFRVWMKISSVARTVSRPLSCWDEAIVETGDGWEENAWGADCQEESEPIRTLMRMGGYLSRASGLMKEWDSTDIMFDKLEIARHFQRSS